MEDIHELEEKGLLRRGSRSVEHSRDRWENGHGRENEKGKGKEMRLEKVTMTLEEQGGVGLSSKRDREAFALLVVLCK